MDTPAENTAAQSEKASPIELIGSEYENGIKLLQNRFRIDHNVEEVTMVFFREFGSAPVVLVRPDGSKIFQSQVDGKDIFWFDSDTYDMISIKNPVPGPWQAVGQILQGSRVMVLSDIALHADPLPPILFSGEILKQTAYLTNGDKPIDYSQFRDVVELTIDLVSTNNPNYDNFGADDHQIATFEDNGRGMDEAPLDGVFTGQFNLNVPAGEWQPIFRVTTPMFTREQVDPPLRLYPNPVKINVELDGGGNDYHKLLIDVDRDLVDINTLLVDGKVRYPNADVRNFSLTELGSDTREYLIIAYDYGIFRVKMTAYGKTVNGRDFILDVPEYTFLVAEPELPEPEVAESAEQNTVDEVIPETPVAPPEPEGMDDDTLMMWLIIVNGSIIGVGLLSVVIIILLKRRKSKGAAAKPAKTKAAKAPEKAKGTDAADGGAAKAGFLGSLLGKFKKPKE
nr:TIGR03503 family protein [Alteromonas lipolytica]